MAYRWIVQRACGVGAGLAAGLFGMVGIVSADSLELTNKMAYRDVRINGIRGSELQFTTTSGSESSRPLSQIKRITLDGEVALNAAEEAFVQESWDKAIEGYEKTLRATTKEWLKDWCSARLLESAGKAGRFDAAVRAFVELARKSPQAAEAMELPMPAANSAYLSDAIKLVHEASIDPKASAPAQAVLLKTLVKLNNAKGDEKGAAAAAERLVQLQAQLDPNSPEARRAVVLLKLKNLRVALAGKEYAKVVQTIREEGAVITEPADQAEALYCLAEAQAGLAANRTDPETWKEVALAYMRVVAHAPANAPQVPQALLKVADIHAQRLGDKPAATALYKQIQAQYPDQEAAKEAGKKLNDK